MGKLKYTRMELLMAFWTLFIGLGALVGALMFWSDPTGKTWMMEEILQTLRNRMPFPGIFFSDFIPSGFALLSINGLPQYYAAYLVIRKRPEAPSTVMTCGILLMCWIIAEWCLFGFIGICNAFFTFGFLEAATGLIASRK